ncbi:hypothetical protein [Streptomyces sp. NPDC055099]
MAGDEYDALMAALTDEPVPGGPEADPGFAAEHAAAVADVALLREHIGQVGRALAAPEAGPKPQPEPDRPTAVCPAGLRRRRVTTALGLAAAAAAVSLVGGAAWLAIESGSGISKSADSGAAKGAAPEAGDDDRAGSADQKSGYYVPCARLIVEGTVKRVEPVPGGVQDRIVLDVTRYYKPSRGDGQVTFVMDVDVDPRLRPGDRTLIGIPKGEASPDIWSNKKADIARDRAWIERELRQEKDRGKGEEMTC